MIELLGQLSNYLGLPSVGSSHGLEIDYMNGWVHWLMLVLFVGWGAFFIFTVIKFREKSHPKANYDGVKSSFSKYTEVGIIVFEAILLVGFAYPIWSEVKTAIPEITDETIEVRVIAQQFAWNCHYPGEDGIFGPTRPELVDEETNPVGIDRSSPAGADDIFTINQLHLPVNKLAMIYLSSKDVIHSFALPEMRVKQDAIPGMSIPVFFTPTKTSNDFLEEIKGSPREGKGYEIACAQLCGNSHYRMRGFLTVDTNEEYEAFLAEEAEYLEEEDDEDW
jgi:cytochrome c oxidase subunit 2